MKTSSCNQKPPIEMKDGRVFLQLSWCMGDECKKYPCGHVKDWIRRHVKDKMACRPREVIQDAAAAQS
jgi:hypothetical protein